jgi:type IV secretory pathway TraG/TraD family ATPase VirD4
MGTALGTAAWADPDGVVAQCRYEPGKVWLGRAGGSDDDAPIGYVDDRHICLVSGSRGGKGTTIILPVLAGGWPGSVCVVDPKGENATVTAARRGAGSENCDGMGQQVHVLDPFRTAAVDPALQSRFNPLDALNPDNEETIDEAGRIADALVVVKDDKDPFWDESARAMVKGLILHVLTAFPFEGERNLLTVRKLAARGDWKAVETLQDMGVKEIASAQVLLWDALIDNPAFDGVIAGIGSGFAGMLDHSPKQFESVLQVVSRNLEFMDSPGMRRVLEGSDFNLSDLKTRPEGVSLYLCLPQRYMSTHYRWLRMMIALTITEMEIVRGKPATGHRLLMVLDEFAGLKFMEVIQNSVAQIAGFGVKMLFVLQSLEQLKGTYKDHWETFLANSGLKLFFNLEDHFSREYVSKLIGETELSRETGTHSETTGESESTSRGTSESLGTSENYGTSSQASRSRSKSGGTNRSTGRSVSSGTNKSTGRSHSTGTNESTSDSRGGSSGTSWGEGHTGMFPFFRRPNESYSEGSNWGRSRSKGKSEGWSDSETEGTSEGRSLSENEGSQEGWSDGVTDGSSTTQGSSTSRTTGTNESATQGTSRSTAVGRNESLHRRSLIHPDEIGRMFGRVDDPQSPAYPGLAIALVSGQQPVVVQRVNYHEAPEFIRCFDPHPDHPFTAALMHHVERERLLALLKLLRRGSDGLENRRIEAKWLTRAGECVRQADAMARVSIEGSPDAHVRSPRGGKITTLTEFIDDGVLFSVGYYANQAAGEPCDPFAEIEAAWAALQKKTIAPPAPEKQPPFSLRIGKRGWIAAAVLAGVFVLRMIFGLAHSPNSNAGTSTPGGSAQMEEPKPRPSTEGAIKSPPPASVPPAQAAGMMHRPISGELMEQLIKAADAGDIATIKTLRPADMDLQDVLDQCFVAVMQSGMADRDEALTTLINGGAKAPEDALYREVVRATQDESRWCRDIDVRNWLRAKSDVHYAHDAALFFAAERGCGLMVDMLLKHGADVHASAPDGQPSGSLALAAAKDKLRQLLASGSDSTDIGTVRETIATLEKAGAQ